MSYCSSTAEHRAGGSDFPRRTTTSPVLWARLRLCCLLPPLSPPLLRNWTAGSFPFVLPQPKVRPQISKPHCSAPKVPLKPRSRCLLCHIDVKTCLRAPAISLKTFLLWRQQVLGVCREIFGRTRISASLSHGALMFRGRERAATADIHPAAASHSARLVGTRPDASD